MNTSNDLNPLTGKLETVVKRAEDKAPQWQDLGAGVNNAVRTAKNAVADASATTAQTLKSAAISADDYVHDNPWIAIGVTAGIAAAVGYLVGRLATPQTRRLF